MVGPNRNRARAHNGDCYYHTGRPLLIENNKKANGIPAGSRHGELYGEIAPDITVARLLIYCPGRKCIVAGKTRRAQHSITRFMERLCTATFNSCGRLLLSNKSRVFTACFWPSKRRTTGTNLEVKSRQTSSCCLP